MWRRREPERGEPAARPEAAAPPASEAPPEPRATEPPADTRSNADDPYAEFEKIFDEPIVLEDPGTVPRPGPGPEPAREEPPPPAAPDPSPRAPTSGAELAQRLLARLDALEGELQAGSARTLEALRRLGERVGAELAMLDKRAVNLELTVARLRSVTEAMELALRSGAPAAPQAAPAPEPPGPQAARPAQPPAAREGSLFGPDEGRPSVWSDEPTD